MSLNNEPCMVRPAFIGLNRVEFNLYPFMASLDKCSRSCNAADDLCTKLCIPSETKDINIKVFKMVTSQKRS